jgi:hypothetical protein
LLDEAERYGLDSESSAEDAFALRETQRRYLPETLAAYEAIPPALRGIPDANGKTPDALLTEQLQILERATAQRVARLSDSRRGDLSANGRFLSERLGTLDSLPEVAIDPSATGEPVLAKRFVDGLRIGAQTAPDVIAAISARFMRELPALVTVERSFLGMGSMRSFGVTIPLRGGESYRYVLGIGANRQLEATCAKIVRGVTIRTESVDFDSWAHALFEDLHAFALTQQRGQQLLDSLLKG